MNIGAGRVHVDLGEIEGMDDAGIEREIAAQLVDEVVQHPPISPMAIDDDEIAGRQRTHDVAGKLPQQGDEVLNAQGERSRRPVMLARQTDGNGGKLP